MTFGKINWLLEEQVEDMTICELFVWVWCPLILSQKRRVGLLQKGI